MRVRVLKEFEKGIGDKKYQPGQEIEVDPVSGRQWIKDGKVVEIEPLKPFVFAAAREEEE